MTWQSFSITVVLVIATAIAIACMQAAWIRRKTPGARFFAWMMLAVAIWTLGSALEYAADSYSYKVLWSKFEYIGIPYVGALWLLFTTEYSQAVPRLNLTRRRSFLALFAIPAATTLMALTNEWHGLIWRSIDVLQPAPNLIVAYRYGVWFWVMAVYSYVLLLLGAIVLGWSLARFPDFYRRQSAAIIIGAVIPWIVNGAHLAGFQPLPGTDLTPVAFAFAGAVYVLEVFRYHLFDLVPVAQDTVVESMSDGVIVVDDRERIVYINAAGKEMLQVEENGSAPAGSSIAVWPEILHALRQTWKTPADGKGSGKNGDYSKGIQIRIDDLMPRYLEMQIDPLNRSRSHAAGRLILLRDVTNHIASEEQLRLQSVALAAAPSSIVITDHHGTIQWVNPAFSDLTGYTLEEALGKNPSILKSGKHDDAFYENLWQTILLGNNWQGEIVNRRKDGNIYVEDSTIAPVFDAQGQITHFIAIKQDVTARKELEKARDDLIQAIVHDLRNPINNVLFSLEMIQRLPVIEQLPSEISSMIAISRENSWRMLGMINSMLDLNRLESGSLPLLREPVVLAELVEQTIHSQSLLAQRREVLILNGVPYDMPRVVVDRVLISRVLQNLLDNALKFTSQGSNIEIHADIDVAGSGIIVSVHDDGPGIPDEMRGVLFQKFVTGTTPQRGSGLGLAFCRLAVEAHKGRIWVESAGGTGTTFLFSLPTEGEEDEPVEVGLAGNARI